MVEEIIPISEFRCMLDSSVDLFKAFIEATVSKTCGIAHFKVKQSYYSSQLFVGNFSFYVCNPLNEEQLIKVTGDVFNHCHGKVL